MTSAALGHRLRKAERRDRPELLLVRLVDPVEFAQQSRPFVPGGFIAAAGRALTTSSVIGWKAAPDCWKASCIAQARSMR